MVQSVFVVGVRNYHSKLPFRNVAAFVNEDDAWDVASYLSGISNTQEVDVSELSLFYHELSESGEFAGCNAAHVLEKEFVSDEK